MNAELLHEEDECIHSSAVLSRAAEPQMGPFAQSILTDVRQGERFGALDFDYQMKAVDEFKRYPSDVPEISGYEAWMIKKAIIECLQKADDSTGKAA